MKRIRELPTTDYGLIVDSYMNFQFATMGRGSRAARETLKPGSPMIQVKIYDAHGSRSSSYSDRRWAGRTRRRLAAAPASRPPTLK